MGEESEQLKEHIERKRDELGRNISELQAKMRQTMDWRTQFRERPLKMTGMAFLAGLLVAKVVRF